MTEPSTTVRPRAAFFSSIQALRGIAAVLVVLFHLRSMEDLHGQGRQILPSLLEFAYGGVDLFFVISGFVMVSVTAGSYRSPAGAGRFLLRRAWRIVPPYWFYTSLLVAPMLLMPGVLDASHGYGKIATSYLLWPQASLPILMVGWTLIYEAYFYLAMAVAIALLPERYAGTFLAAWGVAAMAVHATTGANAPPWLTVASSPMVLEFIAGALVGLHWRRLPARYGLPCLSLGAFAFVASMFVLAQAGAHEPSPMLRTVVFGSASTVIVLGAVAWESAGPVRIPRWLLILGNASYSIYLAHPFVISLTGRLWRNTAIGQVQGLHAASVVVAILLCLAVGIASYRWLERPVQSIGGFLFKPRPTPVAQPA